MNIPAQIYSAILESRLQQCQSCNRLLYVAAYLEEEDAKK
jgi:hypothetical protein